MSRTDRMQEVMNHSWDLATERARADHDDDVARLLVRHAVARGYLIIRQAESPIEADFTTALIPWLLDPGFYIEPQTQLHVPFLVRVDFLARHKDGEGPEVAVELDGHEWHERTKAQAERDKSRDRALLAAGVPVMRFTGSEVYRDPHDCARQVYDMARGLQ